MSGPAAAGNEDGWSAAERWGRERVMSPLDALMWRGEDHPRFSSAGVIVELLDRAPDWERFRGGHDWGTRLVPRFRQRVVEPLLPLPGPIWAVDPGFDLDYHLRRVRLPAPGDMHQLLELARVIALTPLDRARPLWLGTLVEGFEGDRAAYLLHVHHSLMDGAGIVQLLNSLHSNTREPSPEKPLRQPPAAAPTTALGLTVEALSRAARAAPRLAVRSLAVGSRALASPDDTLRYAASLRRVLSATAAASPSPLSAQAGFTNWRYGVLECTLSELKAAGRAAGGTVNDAYVAAVLGGIRRYHEQLGIELGQIPTALPVSVRHADDAPGGNHFTAAFIAGPAGITDPAARIKAIGNAIRPLREEPALDITGTLAPALGFVPGGALRALASRIAPRADVSVSNVPGLTHPVYAAGAEVQRIFILGPLPNVTILAAMISHVGTCCIGLSVDGDVYLDTQRLWICMQASLDQVLALAQSPTTTPGRHEPAPLPAGLALLENHAGS